MYCAHRVSVDYHQEQLYNEREVWRKDLSVRAVRGGVQQQCGQYDEARVALCSSDLVYVYCCGSCETLGLFTRSGQGTAEERLISAQFFAIYQSLTHVPHDTVRNCVQCHHTHTLLEQLPEFVEEKAPI